MRLILIEDNAPLAESLRETLESFDFVVDHVRTLSSARSALDLGVYDLVVLDLGLPDGDGVDLIRQLRRRQVATPVLVITARDALEDRIRGLDSGADDYLVKPFAPAELAARCRALLRRPGAYLGTVLESGNVSLDTRTREVRIDGTRVDMPPREVSVLELLLRSDGRIVTRSAIEASLYSLDDEVTPNAIDASLSRLRKRLVAAGADLCIHTSHGIGYILMPQSTSAH